MADLVVSRAGLVDAPNILEMRDALAQWMLDNRIEQWSPGEMPLSYIEKWFRDGEVYLAWLGGNIVGSVTILWDKDWIWGEQAEQAGYVHQLMIDRAYAGQRTGRELLGWAEDRIAEAGRLKARLDCVCTNRALRTYYERAGYLFVADREFPELPGVHATSLYEKVIV